MATKSPQEPLLNPPIHFFKIILAHTLDEGNLMIPSAFVKKYGEGLANTISLQCPYGAKWKLNLVKSDGKIWFQKGWKEFAEYHSLAHGHLLVFRYKGTSTFQVFIFDMSALEIDYLSKSKGKMALNEPPNYANSKYERPSQKRKYNLSMELPQSCQMRSCKRVKVESSLKSPKAVQTHVGKKCKGKPISTIQKAAALDRSSSFKPSNPSFKIFMHPSYINSRCNLYLSSNFCKRHFNMAKERGVINLMVLNNGRVWPTRYLIRKTNNVTKIELTRESWKAFAKENKLEVGDVCTFELIHRTKLTFLVHISRENDNSNCSTSQAQKGEDNLSREFPQPSHMGSCKRVKVENSMKLPKPVQKHVGKKCKEKRMTTAKQISALDRASSFKPCNPSFMIFMHPSYVNSCGRPSLPSKFCKRHFNMDKERGDINLMVLNNGRVWPSRYLIRKNNARTRFDLTTGWKAFNNDNKLKLGDVCTFELINRTKLTFLVHIFRENDNSNRSTSQAQKRGDDLSMEFPQPCQMRSCERDKVESNLKLPNAVQKHPDKKCKGKPMTTAKQVSALDRASSFKPCNPSFIIFMHPSYVCFHGSPNLPAMFCKRHLSLDKKKVDINLEVLNTGKVWPAKYLVMKTSTRTKFQLSNGWKEFAKDNKLKVGDVCTFELIPGTELTFHVYIFRKNDNSNCSTSQDKLVVLSSSESDQVRATSQGQEQELKIITSIKSSPPRSFSV